MVNTRKRKKARNREVMKFTTWDHKITIPEIDAFIEKEDVKRVFTTRYKYRDNFELHFKKIIAVRNMVTFRNDGKLTGLCSWVLVDDESKKDINKLTWLLPDNISRGDILYVDICLLNSAANIFDVRRFLKEKYADKVRKVYWFNMSSRRIFQLDLKGG